MIHLQKITLREIRLPLAEPFRTARGLVEARRIILLEITDRDGSTAWSECVAENSAGYSSETVDTCWELLQGMLAPAILEQSFAHARDTYDALAAIAPTDRMARAAIEMACWGIQSIQESTSLAEVLARECDAAPRGAVDAGIALGMFPTSEELVDRCRSARDDGYKRIKIKIEPGHDLDLAKSAIQAVDGQLPVSVDANASYTVAEFPALIQLDKLGLAMIEQPLPAEDFRAHAQLKSLVDTPICLDESICGMGDLNEMIALDSAQILNLKPGRVGGFTKALAMHNRCAGAGIPVWCGGMLETGIGRAYNVALASLPNFLLPGDLSPSSRYWERDVITEPWVMTDGTLEVPLDKAGIGVETDTEFVDRLTVRTAAITSA